MEVSSYSLTFGDKTAEDTVAKGKGVTAHDPQHPDNSQSDKGVHHRSEDVLRPHQPAVKHCKPWNHEEYQRRGGEHPGGSSSIDLSTASCQKYW